MQDLLIFILITILFLLAENALLRIFYAMIQEDGPIDVLWKFLTGKSYQDMLKDLYGSQKKWKNNLGKALGDCEMCVAYWFVPMWFFCYYLICRLVVHYWITDAITIENKVGYWVAVVFVNIIWYAAVHGIGALAGWISLMKYKSKLKSGV